MSHLDGLKSPNLQAPLSPSVPVVHGSHSILQLNSTVPSKFNDGRADLVDPDQLFTKCTIAEVRAKQVQLRYFLCLRCRTFCSLYSPGPMLKQSRKNFVSWSGASRYLPCCSFLDCNSKAQGTLSRAAPILYCHNLDRGFCEACAGSSR